MSLSEQQRRLNAKLADLRMEFRQLLHSSFKPLFKHKELDCITFQMGFQNVGGLDVYVTTESPLINYLSSEQIYERQDNKLWTLLLKAIEIAKQFDTEFWFNTFDADVKITFREDSVRVFAIEE